MEKIFYILILFCFYSIYHNLDQKKEFKKGELVFAKILEKPKNCEEINSRTTFIKVFCFNKIFVKKIGLGYCKNLEKDSLQMKISKDKKSIFFINEIENFNENIVSCVLIIAVLVFCVFKIKRK